VGAYFGIQSRSEKSTADGIAGRLDRFTCAHPSDAMASDCSALNAARDRQNTDAIVNYVLYAGGGALAAGAVAAWFLWPKPSRETRPASAARLSPVVGPTQAGLRVEGQF
ncbi:MAG: hypothetical protein JOZ69_10865, partial [Myxococcales bacterium]|nr:hypothetical protein [Myxococcales bacterium]